MFSGLDFTPSPELGNHQSKLLRCIGRPALSLFYFYRYRSSQFVKSIVAQFRKERKPYRASPDSSPALKSGVFSAVFINWKDFTKEPGFGDGGQPECYCHGVRQEEANPVTDKNAADIGCEWTYAFNEHNQMLVLASVNGDSSKMIGMFGFGNPDAKWRIQGVVDLDREEPDWEAIS